MSRACVKCRRITWYSENIEGGYGRICLLVFLTFLEVASFCQCFWLLTLLPRFLSTYCWWMCKKSGGCVIDGKRIYSMRISFYSQLLVVVHALWAFAIWIVMYFRGLIWIMMQDRRLIHHWHPLCSHFLHPYYFRSRFGIIRAEKKDLLKVVVVCWIVGKSGVWYPKLTSA